MSVVLLPKYQIVPGEDPEVTAARLHARKNKPVNQAEDIDYPSYRFRPFPRAMYREWTEDRRERELSRIAGKHALDLEKRNDRWQAESLLGEYETALVGVADYIEHGDRDEVVSELRERNEREQSIRKTEGWADHPNEVKAATRRMQMTLATAAAERAHEDRNLGERATSELEAVDDAADDHVVDVSATRKELKERGKLPKDK